MESGILDTIIGFQTQSSLTNFQPFALVERLLVLLKLRDREILIHRFGLDGQDVETLEAIGVKHGLTRERVRQIEKDSLSQLRKKKLPEYNQAAQLIFDMIVEHGNVIATTELMKLLFVGKGTKDERAIVFLLSLGDQFRHNRETPEFKESWSVVGYNLEKLSAVVSEFIKILKTNGNAQGISQLLALFGQTDYFFANKFDLTDKVLKSCLNLSKAIQINPFAEIGLRSWSEVVPRDVGDKAYLILKHHGKPEHYSEITKLINDRKFDNRTAYQETVHNELIKDKRFVLVGRGIYALSEWGYKKGVVADVIKEIMGSAGRPLAREEIIAGVLQKRQVKRNTILVGLSNRKYFVKADKDKYTLANNDSNIS